MCLVPVCRYCQQTTHYQSLAHQIYRTKIQIETHILYWRPQKKKKNINNNSTTIERRGRYKEKERTSDYSNHLFFQQFLLFARSSIKQRFFNRFCLQIISHMHRYKDADADADRRYIFIPNIERNACSTHLNSQRRNLYPNLILFL